MSTMLSRITLHQEAAQFPCSRLCKRLPVQGERLQGSDGGLLLVNTPQVLHQFLQTWVVFPQTCGEQFVQKFSHADSVIGVLEHIKQQVFNIHRDILSLVRLCRPLLVPLELLCRHEYSVRVGRGLQRRVAVQEANGPWTGPRRVAADCRCGTHLGRAPVAARYSSPQSPDHVSRGPVRSRRRSNAAVSTSRLTEELRKCDSDLTDLSDDDR